MDQGELLASQEVHNISLALGIEPGANDLSDLRYHKICILADADSDGLHISALICALFSRGIFRPWFGRGIFSSPCRRLYRVDVGKEVFTRSTKESAREFSTASWPRKSRARFQVTRFKGLGEMNPAQLRETTMAPETRRLVQLTIEAKDKTEQVLDMLLAKKRAKDRRKWLETKGNLAEI